MMSRRLTWAVPLARIHAIVLALTGVLCTMTTQVGAEAIVDATGSLAAYRAIIKREADNADLPFDIADTVMAIESGYDQTKIGSVGEIGLMQVRPGTAAMLGFKGSTAELATPEVNIHYGVTYLAEAWHLANGNLCRALMKYRAGHGEEAMTPRSVTYCSRAQARLAAIRSPFFESGLASTNRPGSREAHLASVPKLNIRLRGAAFWTAQSARVHAISARIERRWRTMAAR